MSDYSFPIDDEMIAWDWFDDDEYQVPEQEWLPPDEADWPPEDETLQPEYVPNSPLPESLADRCSFCPARDGQCSH